MTGRRDKLLLLLLLFGHAAVGAVLFRYGTDLQDEGLLHAWAARLLRGELPYTDFYMVQAPGSFYVQAVLMKLFGVSWTAGRLLKQVEGLLVILLSYGVVLRATGSSRAGLVAALAATLFSAALHWRLPWYSTEACIFVLTALWFAVGWLRDGGGWRLLAAGVAIGCSILFKQNHGLFGGAAIAAVLAFAQWRDGEAEPIGPRARRALAAAAPIALGTVFVVGAYLVYYAASGGSLRLLWLNSFVWASEAKGHQSAFETLVYPIWIFSLYHKGSVIYPIASLALLAGLGLVLVRHAPTWLRIGGLLAAGATILLGPDFLVRAYVWSLGAVLVFGIAAAALFEAVRAGPDPVLRRRANAAALVAVLAAANLYGGTIPGGGWGRLVETLPATLLCFGIGAALLQVPEGAFARLWSRITWLRPRAAGIALAVSGAVVATGLLATNAAYRPLLDVGLRSMSGEAQEPGWKGIRGDALYISETDELIRTLRELPERDRRRVYVFPLNCALYPLAGARNPTEFDSHQKDFLAPSQFPRVLEQLESAKPEVIVLQRAANQALGPLPDDPTWVDGRLRSAVLDFVHANYRLHTRWQYYELWKPAEANGS